jgi:hypothetical protein
MEYYEPVYKIKIDNEIDHDHSKGINSLFHPYSWLSILLLLPVSISVINETLALINVFTSNNEDVLVTSLDFLFSLIPRLPAVPGLNVHPVITHLLKVMKPLIFSTSTVPGNVLLFSYEQQEELEKLEEEYLLFVCFFSVHPVIIFFFCG